MSVPGSLYIFIALFHSCVFTNVYCTSSCPHKDGNPYNVNDRIDAFKDTGFYTCKDDSNLYVYKLGICQAGENLDAVEQTEIKTGKLRSAGKYKNAVVRGGTDWIMITYGGGEEYKSHCSKEPRKSDLFIICDPHESKGTLKIIEEYRTNTSYHPSDPCYYLFELNHKAACAPTPPKTISAGSILLIIFLIVVSAYLLIGFLYQRFVAGAKGFEQIPHFNMWRAFGNLQADGCNFICRCAEVRRPPRYKPVEDALSDDTVPPDDDKLLPM